MKRLDPPISVHDTYEKVKPRLLKSEEFQAVASEDARRGAFDKYLRRLREKEEDTERDRQRRREREDRSYRERDRGERPHRHGSGRAGRSRSPEPDPYEADRRKAIAERERNYHKTSMAESLLSDHRSPESHYDGYRDRGRDHDRARDRDRERDRDRFRDEDRPPRPRRDDGPGHYDRERRDREEERERLYRRRAVDRDPDELNYGDEKPLTSARRRRDEEDPDRRDSRDSKVRLTEDTWFNRRWADHFLQRLRRDSPRERTPHRDRHHSKNREPPPPPPPVEEPSGIRSGSEEGEIEED